MCIRDRIEILESRRRQKLWEEWKEVVGRLDEVRRDAETKKLQSEQGDKECNCLLYTSRCV